MHLTGAKTLEAGTEADSLQREGVPGSHSTSQLGQRCSQNVTLSPPEAAGGRVSGKMAGGSVAVGWHTGSKSQSRTRVCSWLEQFTLCTTWSASPLSWQRPCQVQAPQPGRASVGKGRLVQHLLGTQGGRKCRWRLPIQKHGENSLNNGRTLRLSPRLGPGPGRPQRSLCGH